MAALLWPYEELELRRGEASFHYLASTPWSTVRLDTNPAGRRLAERLLSGPPLTAAESIRAHSALFGGLLHEPFCYVLPRAGFGAERDTQPSNASPVQFAPGRWNEATSLRMSRIAGTKGHDPLTLLTIFRRFHHLDSMDVVTTVDVCRALKGLRDRPDAFARAACYVTAQNWYVTRRCEEVVSAALALAQRAKPRLSSFIKSERRHDVILERAVRSIQKTRIVEPRWCAPNPATVALMDEFKAVARANFLSFAFAVCLFERGDHAPENRIAAVIAEAGFPDAARLLERHAAINEDGGHDRVGLDLLDFMAPVSSSYARQALRGAERLSRRMAALPGALLKRFPTVSRRRHLVQS